MKKYLKLFAAGVITSMALIGCGQQEEAPAEENEGATETPTEELTKIDLMLDWYPNAVHSYLYTAIEKGYFEEEGLDVNIMFPANPTDPLTLAASGNITLGIYYQPDVIMARDNEVPVVSVGAIVREPLNYMMVMADSEIQSPKDLEGKQVGYPGIQINEPLLKTMVEADGGDASQVALTDVGFELGSSIVTNRVDAVIGTFINHEFPVLKHQGEDVRYFNPTDFGVPNYYELVFVSSEETVKNQQADIEAFLRAASKGYEFMKNNPAEALDILFANEEKQNFPLIREVEEESLQILLPKMETETESFGSQSAEVWNEVAEWLLSVGLIKELPNTEEIFINLK